ncbi:hypothetical protein BGZ61DRAFT_352267 [Ilyonectria robusta]|uniref:uncharacterized protein n=1 Tax=Ilyonectria robusta TaxID=1079257 RepID=UPI001E8CFA80|nr:uncharacterized protein BGZ61DRAFT_352267 [Ilyonectria robusta]KAH8694814.1 hypothetical protein BGZ61DRAFT_352267 [Ilyonectria robusta]
MSTFPPVDAAVLQNNPDFAILYGKLTHVVLNPDGSTKEDPAAKERAAVREELDRRRLEAAKNHILARAIATATPADPASAPRTSRLRPQHQQQPSQPPAQQQQSSLSEPLVDLLLILPPLLNPDSPPLPQASLELLFAHPPLSDIESLLPVLAPLLASSLRSSALSLARIAHPSTNPSYLHRHIAALPQTLATLRTDLAAAQSALVADRLRSLTALTTVLHASTQALAHLVRALEVKHGVVARSLELRAAEVSLQAQRHDADAALAVAAVRRDVYTPEALAALKNYAAHLRDARIRSEERIRGLKAELSEYGVGVDGGEGKQKMMKEMSRVYRDMGRQMDDVRGDLERLHHS